MVGIPTVTENERDLLRICYLRRFSPNRIPLCSTGGPQKPCNFNHIISWNSFAQTSLMFPALKFHHLPKRDPQLPPNHQWTIRWIASQTKLTRNTPPTFWPTPGFTKINQRCSLSSFSKYRCCSVPPSLGALNDAWTYERKRIRSKVYTPGRKINGCVHLQPFTDHPWKERKMIWTKPPSKTCFQPFKSSGR